MPAERDPLSVQFDAAAVAFLRRGYANRGGWTGTYLGPPSPMWRAWAAAAGIDLMARDRWGEVRWVRAFKRACFWNLKHYGYAGELRPGQDRAAPHAAVSMEWQTGQRVMRPGWPARRWAIRITIHPRSGAWAAVQARPPARQFTSAAGETLRSTVDDRDW
jgi:hypothetical protein